MPRSPFLVVTVFAVLGLGAVSSACAGGGGSVIPPQSTEVAEALATQVARTSDSDLPTPALTIQLGTQAPDFEWKDASGGTYRLGQILGRKPVIINLDCCGDISSDRFKEAIQMKATFGEDLEVLAVSYSSSPTPLPGIPVLLFEWGHSIYGGEFPSTFYINREGILVAEKFNEPEDYIVRALLEQDLAYDTNRSPHFMPFDLDLRFSGAEPFEAKADLLTGDINDLSSNMRNAVLDARDESLYPEYMRRVTSREFLDGAKTADRDVRLFEGRGERERARKESNYLIGSLLRQGREDIELYCQTRDERIVPIVRGIGSLAYSEYEEQVQEGRLDPDEWVREQMFRHFDITCQSPYV